MFDFLGCSVAVPPHQMSAIVRTESSANPYAIGVVGHYLSRQPSSEAEALEVITQLQANGHNYSVGLAQVNKVNFGRYLSKDKLFSRCDNLLAGSKILKACYTQYQDWQKAYSCYYSGNPTTGFAHGYVRKVLANKSKPLLTSLNPTPASASSTPIVLIPHKQVAKQTASARAVPPVQPPSLLQRRLNANLSSFTHPNQEVSL